MSDKKVTFKEKLKKVNWKTVGTVFQLAGFGICAFKLGQKYNDWIIDRGMKRLTDDGFVSMTKLLPDGTKEIMDTSAVSEWRHLVDEHYGTR